MMKLIRLDQVITHDLDPFQVGIIERFRYFIGARIGYKNAREAGIFRELPLQEGPELVAVAEFLEVLPDDMDMLVGHF